jgi:hypothetical protein
MAVRVVANPRRQRDHELTFCSESDTLLALSRPESLPVAGIESIIVAEAIPRDGANPCVTQSA